MAKRKVRPVPEIVAPDIGWRVQDSAHGAHCSRQSRTFTTPHDGSPFARGVTLHELAHVKWSPSSPKATRYKGDPQTLLACEDGRVNALVMRHVAGARDWYADALSVIPDAPPMEQRIRGLLLAGERKEAARLIIASVGQSQRDLYALLPDADKAIVKEASRLLLRTPRRRRYGSRPYVLPFKNTKAAATYLDAAYVPPPPPDDELPTDLAAQWSPMAVGEPSRTLPTLASRRFNWVARDSGGSMRRADRYFADGMPFAERLVRKERGGVVIVDGSCSVGLTDDELERLLATAPAATVAIYSEAGTRANLTVLAHAGKRVASVDCRPAGGGNGCDAAALLWGGKYSGPRLWLSDGEVCSSKGINARMLADVRRVAGALAYRRTASVDDTVRALLGKSVPALRYTTRELAT